jgi:hypothetical protein
MSDMKVGDFVVMNKPGYTRRLRKVLRVDQDSIFVTSGIGTSFMQIFSYEQLRVVTKESNPEYFI